jgi:hypothetical protein
MDWHIPMNSIRTRTIYLNKGQWILCASITSCKIVWNITTNKYNGPEQSSNFSTVESDAHFLKWRAKFKKILSLPRLSFLLKRKPQSMVNMILCLFTKLYTRNWSQNCPQPKNYKHINFSKLFEKFTSHLKRKIPAEQESWNYVKNILLDFSKLVLAMLSIYMYYVN